MKSIMRRWWAAVILLSLSASGCVSSTCPLSDDKTSQPDVRLLGKWELAETEDNRDGAGAAKQPRTITLEVKPKEGSPNVLQVFGDDGEVKETADLFLTKIGDRYIASLDQSTDDGKQRYMIVKYDLTPQGQIDIWVLDTDFVATAVENLQLKGTVKQELFKDVMLDDTPENLRKFIEQNADKCFKKEEPLEVKRIK